MLSVEAQQTNEKQVLHKCYSSELAEMLAGKSEEIANLRLQCDKVIRQNTRDSYAENLKAAAPEYVIPVVFHVVHQPGTPVGQGSNLSEDRVNLALQYLNESFSNTGDFYVNGGYDTGFRFCLAQTDPNGNATNGITRTASSEYTNLEVQLEEPEIKENTVRWDANKYMNIWVVDEVCYNGDCNIGGYSYQANTHGSIYDGIVIEDLYVASNLQFTKILIHEIGHYFDLYHPFEDGCINNDCLSDNDKVCDTPPENSQVAHSCDSTPNSCFTDDDDLTINNPFRPVSYGGLGDQYDLIENYMDYGYLNCRTCFTAGQIQRMHISFNNFRTSLLNSNGCTYTNTPPVVVITCNPPNLIQINNTEATQANISWASINNADSYKVEYQIAGTNSILSTNTTNTDVTLTALQSNTNYEFRLASICGGVQSSSSSFFSFSTDTTPVQSCSSPNNVSFQNITTNNALITWSSVSGASNYNCFVRAVGGTWVSHTTTSNSKYLSGLTPGTTYQVRVETICGGTTSISSPTTSFNTISNVPNCVAPTSLTINSVGIYTAYLTWASTSGSLSYIIRYKKDGTTNWSSVSVNSTDYTLTNLSPDTKYYVKISSVCNGETIEANNQFFFITNPEPVTINCEYPANLQAINITSSSALLKWASVSNSASYVVQFREGGQNWTPYNANSTQFNVGSLKANTYYEFRVYSICSGFSSEYSSIYGFSTASETVQCEAPNGLSIQNITANSGFAVWTSFNNATAYNVSIRESGTSNWIDYTTTESLFNFTTLKSGTNYIVIVSSECGAYESGNYATASFATNDAVAVTCPTPVNLSVNNVTQNSASFSWSGSNNIDNYYLFIREQGGTWANYVVQSNQYSTNNLQAGTTYDYRVLGNCNGVSTAFSSIKSFTTLQATNTVGNGNSCSAPTNLNAASISQTTANITWNDVPNNSFYILGYTESGVSNAWDFKIVNNSNNFLITGLLPNKSYTVKIRTMCGETPSDFSSQYLFTTSNNTTVGNNGNNNQGEVSTGNLCAEPTGIGAYNITNTSATLHWDNVSKANQYIVHISGVALANPIIEYVNDNEYELTNLLINTNYSMKVKSICGIDISGYSSTFTFTTTNQQAPPDTHTQACNSPENLNIVTVGSTMIQVNWSNVTASDYYQAELFKNGVYQTATTVTNNIATFTDVDTNENLTVRIKAKCGQLWSAYSAFMTITTNSDAPECTVPNNVNISNISENGAIASWATTNEADYYELIMWQVGYESVTFNYTVTGNSRSINTLKPCTDYAFKVRSMCNEDKGSYTANKSFSTACTIAVCDASGQNTGAGYISQVKIGDLGNITDNDNGYNSFPDTKFVLNAGSSNTFEMKASTGNPFYWGIWIDKNKDGEFDKYNERVYISTTARFGTCAGFITISPDAEKSTTTMRVIMSNSYNINPCADFEFGEVEDYSIEITD